MTGLFSCTLAEAERVAEAERGEAPLAEAEAFPLADAARARLAAALKARATALFQADRRAKLDPLLRASGVTVASAAPAAAKARP
jgi:hypothetical protein